MVLVVNILPTNAGEASDTGSVAGLISGKISWRRKWHPTVVFLLGNFHGLRSYSPRDCKELNKTMHAHTHRSNRKTS